MSRERLPNRRKSWTQKVQIDGQTFYATFGEYSDGRLGEVFIEAHKEGTFSRGVLSALGRVMSIALQCGAVAADIVKALRYLNFPPNGKVEGSLRVDEAKSVADWLAQEIEDKYVLGSSI